MKETRPVLGVTMGDASGAGPEILVKALSLCEVRALCRPIVIGDAATVRQAAQIVGSVTPIHSLRQLSGASFEDGVIEVLDLQNIDLSRLVYGKLTPWPGRRRTSAWSRRWIWLSTGTSRPLSPPR